MKQVTPALNRHLQSGNTTMAICMTVIPRSGGNPINITTHEEMLTVDGVQYWPLPGFNESAFESTSDFAVDSLEVTLPLGEGFVSFEYAEYGFLGGSEYFIFALNFLDPSMGVIKLRRGRIGKVTVLSNGPVNKTEGVARLELRGLLHLMNTADTAVYSPLCRATFGIGSGDPTIRYWCGVDGTKWTYFMTVNQMVGDKRREFRSYSITHYEPLFKHGKITWASGKNVGIVSSIVDHSWDIVRFLVPTPYEIAVGDTGWIQAGCDGTFLTCKNKFNNAQNFKGEPHVPGETYVHDWSTK